MRRLARGLMRLAMNARMVEWRPEEMGRPAVVFAPHQDDETLGCGGTIVRKRRAGADVHIAFVTDGSQSHARLMDPAKLSALRAQEALDAAEVLGVAKDHVHFLNFKDGQVSKQEEIGVEKVSALLRELRPEEVFVPYYQDTPPDHEASARIVLASLRQVVGKKGDRPFEEEGRSPFFPNMTVYEYPVWFWYHWPWVRPESRGRERLKDLRRGLRACRYFLRDFRCFVRIDDVLDEKRAALAKHRSQVEQLIADPAWTTLGAVSGGEWLDCFFQPREVFYRHGVGT